MDGDDVFQRIHSRNEELKNVKEVYFVNFMIQLYFKMVVVMIATFVGEWIHFWWKYKLRSVVVQKSSHQVYACEWAMISVCLVLLWQHQFSVPFPLAVASSWNSANGDGDNGHRTWTDCTRSTHLFVAFTHAAEWCSMASASADLASAQVQYTEFSIMRAHTFSCFATCADWTRRIINHRSTQYWKQNQIFQWSLSQTIHSDQPTNSSVRTWMHSFILIVSALGGCSCQTYWFWIKKTFV